MTRSTFAPRAAAAAAAATILALIAAPALAAENDLSGSKSNDAAGALAHGDSVEFTVNVANPSATAQTAVTVTDEIPEGLVYVADSTEVTVTNYTADTATEDFNSDYAGDGASARWIGSWTEINDDDVATTGSVIDDGLDAGDQFAVGLQGNGTTGDTNPGIYHQIDVDGVVALYLEFATNNSDDTEADDTLDVWTSTSPSGPWTPVPGANFTPGSDAADTARDLDLTGAISGSTMYLRFGVSGGAGDATEWWSVDTIRLHAVEESTVVNDNDAGTLTDGVAGVGSELIAAADAIGLNAQITSVPTSPAATLLSALAGAPTATSGLWITYDATVDVSVFGPDYLDYPGGLVNFAAFSSAEDPASGDDLVASLVEIDYEPGIDVAVSSNGPVSTGQPIIITIVFEHGDDSDGSPVCITDPSAIEFPAGATDVNIVATVGDEDQCLENGEVWTVTITYPARDTAQTVPFAVGLEGRSIDAGQEGDIDVNVTASTDVVVVLADTGAANTGLAGVAAALVALGAAALVVARRRNA